MSTGQTELHRKTEVKDMNFTTVYKINDQPEQE